MKSENTALDFKGRSQDLAGDLASLTVSGMSASLAPQSSFLLEYWTILRKRRWIVISVILVSVALTALITARQKPMYSAVGRIAINRESAVNLGTKDSQFVVDDSDSGDYSVDMETQIKVLQSDATIYQVIKALHLDTSPEFGGLPTKHMENSLQIDSAQQTALLKPVPQRIKHCFSAGHSNIRDPLLESQSPASRADCQPANHQLYRAKSESPL